MGTLWVQQCISPLVFEIVRERNDAAMSTLFRNKSLWLSYAI